MMEKSNMSKRTGEGMLGWKASEDEKQVNEVVTNVKI